MRILKFVLPTMLALAAHGASVSWSSGTLVLPDGNVAKTGDVRGWAWVQNRIPTTSETSGVSDSLATYLYATLLADDEIRNMAIGGLLVRDNGNKGVYAGKSNSSGIVSIDGGQVMSNGYANYTADILWVCEYDGYEYYMGSHGIHYSTAAWPQLENTNLAAGGEWIRGEAIPEPHSVMLLLLGSATLLLKRKDLRRA